MALFVLIGGKMDVNLIKEPLETKLKSLGYELSSISFGRKEGNLTLSIVVDRVEPIDMDAIVKLTDELNPFFDEIVKDDTPYNLDISSLGAEKPLKIENLNKYVGSYIELRLINPINGENIYFGDIVEVSTNELSLSYKQKNRTKVITTQLSNINKVKLAIKF